MSARIAGSVSMHVMVTDSTIIDIERIENIHASLQDAQM
jgi:hypothetical protein